MKTRFYDKKLSREGVELLKEPEVYTILESITRGIGITPEEYLLAFEEVLATDPTKIFKIFEH